MPGFLDPDAPSTLAEYSRYINSDILGKILFKSFCRNILDYPEESIYVPLGRHPRYDHRKISADAQVFERGTWMNAEIKCSHVNILHLHRPNPLKCWSFGRVLYTTRRIRKEPFDFVFAAGIHARGLGDPEYWRDIETINQVSGRTKCAADTMPHEPSFLSRCGIFLLPYHAIGTNDVAVTISKIPTGKYSRFFAWGYDARACRRLWDAVASAVPAHRSNERLNASEPQLQLAISSVQR